MKVVLGLILVFSSSVWAQKNGYLVSCEQGLNEVSVFVESKGVSDYKEIGHVNLKIFDRSTFTEKKKRFDVFALKSISIIPIENNNYGIAHIDIPFEENKYLIIDVKGKSSVVQSTIAGFEFADSRMDCVASFLRWRPGVSGGN